jgi:hypothetical protein
MKMNALLVFGYGMLMALGVGLFQLGLQHGSGIMWGLGVAGLFIAGGFAAEIYQRML